MRARHEDVVFMQLESRVSTDYLGELLNAALSGCRQMKTIMTSTIKTHMETMDVMI